MSIAAICLAFAVSASPILPLDEQRYCGAPVRLADGSIRRRADVLAAFKRAHPCPATGLPSGPCPGWYMDHVVPLACGGCDAVSNLQWLPEDLWRKKSLFERAPGIYCPAR